MRYIPHTERDVSEMLAVCGLAKVEDLFTSVTSETRLNRKLNLPPPLPEQELLNHIKKIAAKNIPAGSNLSFLGAGCYNHFVPAAIGEIVGRSEWLTPYTPYQPEISQGTLQAVFEYQTMICNLTGMEVANASHYDGATATAEAALMSTAITKRNNVVISSSLHPEYRDVIKTILRPRGKEAIEVGHDEAGKTNFNALEKALKNDCACFIMQSPNFFGIIEDLGKIDELVKSNGALFVVSITDPISLGILKGPGEFGADIVTAEGQAFGCCMNYGGPFLGIFATREKFLRAMPGRIAGMTVDKDGRRGFVLTMSTREQHIRRERAASNICSNEALMALTACVYLALMGKNGLKKIAEINLMNANYLKSELSKIPGIDIRFNAPVFNEFVITVNKKTDDLNKALLSKGIFGGVPLDCWYPDMKNDLLICSTECHSKNDLDRFVSVLKDELEG